MKLSDQSSLRTTPGEMSRWKKAAALKGLPWSTYVRLVVNEQVRIDLEEAEERMIEY